ncbi:MAG: zinc-binding dehydrogenase [Candidatus Thorarchaeota archaeon]
MRAAVYEGAQNIELREVPDPIVGPNDVLVKPKYVGICGTDLSAWEYGMFEGGVIIGHEFSGVVEEAGKDVRSVSKGDSVVPNSLLPCLKCRYCRKERYSLCENMQMPGISMNGGMAELVALPEPVWHRLPPGTDLRGAALVEPLSIVVRGFKRTAFRPDLRLLILGAGPIGLLTLLYAKHRGVSEVYVSEVKDARLRLASMLGSTQAINPKRQPLALGLETLTKQGGIDLVVECTGAAEPSSESFSLVNRGGKILVLGICEEPVEADFMTGVLNEITIDFSYLGYAEFPEAIDLISSGKIDVEPLITKVIRLESLIEEGFESLIRPESEDVKVLVEI